MDSVFEKWREKLLDAGKGNRLINYKDTSRTIDVLAPDYETVFHKISNGDTLTFYDVDSFIRTMKESELELGSKVDGKEIGKFDRVTKQQITNMLADKIKKNQILSFKKGATLQKTLKSIRKASIDSLLEKGINILYMAFGFLKWKEKDNSDIFYNSPLILIPISLESTESKNAIFSVVQYEDEVNTNITLNYVMKNEFGLTMPEYQDEKHPEETLTDYINRVKEIVEKKGWDVSYNVAIGTFSFLKMNMYKDLEENEPTILKNNNIKKLLNRQIDEKETANPINIDEYFREGKELSLHNVVDADSSQMQAIIQAQSGKSFVLQGPPGTGKSQTITNLIAEFLYNHKKILFVSEKLEALNVVYNNLKKVGLEDFCLELHSHKTNKKEVINELYRVLNKNKTTVTTNVNDEIQELKKSKNQLDNYNTALHTIEPVIERTPYQIIGAVAKYNEDNQDFEYAIPKVEKKGIDYLKEAVELLDNYSKFSDTIGIDYHANAWYGFIKEDLNYSDKLQLKKNLSDAITYLNNLQKISNETNEKLNIEILKIKQVYDFVELFKVISSLEFFDKNIFKKTQLQKIYDAILEYNKKQDEIISNKKELGEIYNKDIYEINLNDYYLKFKNEYMSFFRFLNSNYRRDVKIIKRYLSNPKMKFSYNDIVDTLKKGKDIQSAEKDLEKLESKIFALLDNKEQLPYNWKDVENELFSLMELLKDDFDTLANCDKKQFDGLRTFFKIFVNKVEELKDKRIVIDNLQDNFSLEIADLNKYDIEELIEIFTNCLNEFDNLDNWMKFNELMNKLEEKELIDFIDKSIENNIDPKKLENTFKLMFYTQWMYFIISKNEVLHNFTRVSQDSAVQNFRKKDKLKFEIAKAEIISKLSAERPSINTLASGSQVSTLVREAGKKRKQKPVRMLLSTISELVQTLKPCFLMSPLSVSTYLSGDSCKFDVVIFDEASQIFPWDAIGAIYRAKQVIVVGDSKQMPPSNYFNAEIVDDSDDDNFEDDDSLDFESILDLCATSFNQERLSWHYRSRTEDLINFSNKNFYDGNLVTFPSATKDNTNTGVDFYYVEKGVFDRKTKTNIIEANKVVDLVFEHFKNTPNRSLGVVAFSISQQNAIESIIQERREKDDKYAEFFDSNKPERFFVKNLETVQGDERDTIIFSVAYARDIDGKFLHNFGPLNRKGGERRLNVAVTRAKYNVKLVSSIKGYDIDLNKTKAVGAKLLKEYLEYAEIGMQNLIQEFDEAKIFESDGIFEDEVYNTLINAGYKITRNVGCSGYKIDLGVKHPTKSDYVLAIECDGANYHSGKTTRDRDRLRQEVLERLGWKFYRVWSTDWFTNNKIEKKKLLDVVAKSIENFDNKEKAQDIKEQLPKEEKPVFIIEQESIKKDLKSEFKEYEIYDIYEIYNRTRRPASFDNVIYNLVKTEAPITEELLLKRTVGFFGNEKVTNVVRSNFYYAMRRHPEIKKVKDYYVVDKDQTIELRIPKNGDQPRDILLIPTIELSSGIHKIIEFNVGINKDGLFRTIANLLGFTRIGDNIRYKLEEALSEELKKGKIKEVNGEFFIK